MYRRLRLGGERFRERLTEHARGILSRILEEWRFNGDLLLGGSSFFKKKLEIWVLIH